VSINKAYLMGEAYWKDEAAEFKQAADVEADEVDRLKAERDELLKVLYGAYVALRTAGWDNCIAARKVRDKLEEYKLLDPEPTT
jgi:hypothetical protein